jgi:hypothetical protein
MTVPQWRRDECRVDGRLVKLRPQWTSLVLALLLAPPGRLLTYGDLVSAVWPIPDLEPDGDVREQLRLAFIGLRKFGIRPRVLFGRGVHSFHEDERGCPPARTLDRRAFRTRPRIPARTTARAACLHPDSCQRSPTSQRFLCSSCAQHLRFERRTGSIAEMTPAQRETWRFFRANPDVSIKRAAKLLGASRSLVRARIHALERLGYAVREEAKHPRAARGGWRFLRARALRPGHLQA